MPNSDSSEDEVNDQLLAAVDTSFLCEKLYETPAEIGNTKKRDKAVESTPVPYSKYAAAKPPVPKSNRYLLEEDSFFHSDLNVTTAVQQHVAGKLSKLIGSVVEFNDSENNLLSTRLDSLNDETGVRLLAGFTEVIDLKADAEIIQPRVKPGPIKRRKFDCEPEVEDEVRITASICDPSAFPKAVQHWKGPRKRSIQYQYKKKQNGTIVEKPLTDEFTKARNANQWHESKIRKFKGNTQNGNANKTT